MTTPPAVDRDQVEPGPTPAPRGDPPAELLCPAGTLPFGMAFVGAVATVRCWMAPCPSCLVGWVPVVPDGSRYGYRLAEIGCSGDLALPGWPDNGCEPALVAWWAALRAGETPPPPEPDERQRAYARAVVRNALADAMDGKNAYVAARRSGGYVKPAGLAPDVLVTAFMAAVPGQLDEHKLMTAVLVGTAIPGRLPR
jgi:hypothetical protein